MFERLNPATRRALFLSKFHASAVGEHCIAPEHLLIGLLREGDSMTEELLRALHVDLTALQRDCGVTMAPPPHQVEGDPRLSGKARKIVASAVACADDLGLTDVVPHCLLLGILREADTSAATLLRRHGVDYATVIDLVRQRHPGG